ncbi:MAG: transcriptional regulator, partial [Chloroflexales bacterium]|nr:transcriptional regulator [Chloroflexales bacterium]
RRLGHAASSVPAPGLLHLDTPAFPADHCALDGSDLDHDARQALLHAAINDPTTAVLLVDLVLGLEAPGDPAATLLDALAAARALRTAPLTVIASVVGTDADPQPRREQVAQLEAAGILVAPSNALAATWAAQIAERRA